MFVCACVRHVNPISVTSRAKPDRSVANCVALCLVFLLMTQLISICSCLLNNALTGVRAYTGSVSVGATRSYIAGLNLP